MNEIEQIQLGMLSMYLMNAAELDPSNPDNQIAPELHEQMYARRNRELWSAAAFAANAGLKVGVDTDDRCADRAYPLVLYIELPTGQVAWHIPAHSVPYDGHDTATKYKRIGDFAEQNDLLPQRPVILMETQHPGHDTPSEPVDSRESE